MLRHLRPANWEGSIGARTDAAASSGSVRSERRDSQRKVTTGDVDILGPRSVVQGCVRKIPYYRWKRKTPQRHSTVRGFDFDHRGAGIWSRRRARLRSSRSSTRDLLLPKRSAKVPDPVEMPEFPEKGR